jgi:hypothetical protein
MVFSAGPGAVEGLCVSPVLDKCDGESKIKIKIKNGFTECRYNEQRLQERS